MAWLTVALSVPFLLLFSLPLAFFAILTTTLAFWLLVIRVVFVYYELAMTLLRASIAPSTLPQPPTPPPLSPTKHRGSPRSRRASRSSSSGSSDLHVWRTTADFKSQSSATLALSTPLRDYEGVGGWRFQEGEEEEALWMGMNSRLELPASQMRRHQRSLTGGSRASSGRASPELVRTPLAIRTPGRGRGPGSGAASPENYFNMPTRVSFESQRSSGGSSSTSLGSGKHTRQDVF